MCGCFSHAPYWEPGPKPRLCPDWEWNQRPSGSQVGTQATEPPDSLLNGLSLTVLKIITVRWLTVKHSMRSTPTLQTNKLRFSGSAPFLLKDWTEKWIGGPGRGYRVLEGRVQVRQLAAPSPFLGGGWAVATWGVARKDRSLTPPHPHPPPPAQSWPPAG